MAIIQHARVKMRVIDSIGYSHEHHNEYIEYVEYLVRLKLSLLTVAGVNPNYLCSVHVLYGHLR